MRDDVGVQFCGFGAYDARICFRAESVGGEQELECISLCLTYTENIFRGTSYVPAMKHTAGNILDIHHL